MGNLVLTLIMNIMMAVLLLVTLLYCRRLNRRIAVLQDARSELAQIVRDFDESTKRATESIAEIHAATSRLSENIQHKIDKANFLADDLQFLIERSAKITGKPEVAQAAAPAGRAATQPRSRTAEPEPAASASEPAAKARPGLRVRSKAEQELLDALKTRE